MKIIVCMVCIGMVLGMFMIPGEAGAFNPIDLEKVKTTKNCPRCDLSGAYLQWANLNGADLRGANLNGANLYKAYLSRATLWGRPERGRPVECNMDGRD